jgi:hypothetical protein
MAPQSPLYTNQSIQNEVTNLGAPSQRDALDAVVDAAHHLRLGHVGVEAVDGVQLGAAQDRSRGRPLAPRSSASSTGHQL